MEGEQSAAGHQRPFASAIASIFVKHPDDQIPKGRTTQKYVWLNLLLKSSAVSPRVQRHGPELCIEFQKLRYFCCLGTD